MPEELSGVYRIIFPSDRSDEDQRRKALDYITDAWIEAVKDGLDPNQIAVAALEASIREMVALRGETYTIDMLARQSGRVEAGECSAHATRQ